MSFDHGHALLIGVGTHRFRPDIDVPITISDAEAMAGVLRDPSFCGYPSAQVTVLHDTGATKTGILAGLDDLAQRTGLEDTVLVFYSGHGALGTDGNYHLVCHDTRTQGNRVVAGTGVSESELLEKLKAICTGRALLLFNACFSGAVSPVLEVGQETFRSLNPTGDQAAAVLATGQGRVIITACGEDQVAYVGSGKSTIFVQAVVDGLRGKGVRNNGGFISAFGLYEHVFEVVTETVRSQFGATQEPELTVLKGVGPFAVALYRGATQPGDLDGTEPVPMGMAAREITTEKAERVFNRQFAQTVYQHQGVVIGGQNQKIEIGGDVVGGSKTEITASTVYIGERDLAGAKPSAGKGLVGQLKRLREMLDRTFDPRSPSEEDVIVARAQVDAALVNAESVAPDANKIVRRLVQAREILEQAPIQPDEAGALRAAFVEAIAAVGQLYD